VLAKIEKISRNPALWFAVAALFVLPVEPLKADPLLGTAQTGGNGVGQAESDASQVTAVDDEPLQQLMQSIVSLEVVALADARTADTFGRSRAGTGIVIDTSGLVVTTGDMVAEAAEITVTFHGGKQSQAELIAYDRQTGLGLVRAKTDEPTVAIQLGQSSEIKKDDVLMVIPSTGEPDSIAVKVGKIDDYSGGWEYVINDALHTFPPSTKFSGAALVSESARLLGIGSLVSIDIDIDPKIRVPGNVFIPVDTLTRVLGKLLLAGRSDFPARQPWIGLDVKKTKRGIAVTSVISEGPAEKAGLKGGDILVAVNNRKIDSQSDFFKKLWGTYKPGDDVEIMVLRGSEYKNFSLTASDYYDWLNNSVPATQLTELVE